MSSEESDKIARRTETKLRHMFISMLFALVVGQLTVTVYTSLQNFEFTLEWLNSAKYTISHFVLALFVITTSWVDWSNTFEEPNFPRLTTIISKGFALLIIDIFILILYFGLIEKIDSFEKPSANPESTLFIMIFVLYIIWDLVYSNSELKKKIWEILPAVLCTLASFLILLLLSLKDYVLLADAMLLLTLFGFRWLKNNIPGAEVNEEKV
ncbi:hypothetical protein [Kangiella sp. M94]